jgi:hypothetical protein
MACFRFRTQDIDFNFINIRIWNGNGWVNGSKLDIVTLAEEPMVPLGSQIRLINCYLTLDRSNKVHAGVSSP